ncbi:Uncharacterised protein [Moraxella lacunata]|uniref:Uncharacterized protein n=1 Tax=Moraxella lacunata TaxID=477 RepID=A0A1V4GPF6_MORLA|nr:hypothetical protein [Moraxella lacunata]OPH34502.1 hypothetical protein B5J94_11415 [Moraxella lacunata]STZ00788.1 Uncharacterised protein [Moraxella lacunata]
MPTVISQNANINAERLFTTLMHNSVLIKDKNSNIEKVALDYQTFVQLQEFLSLMSHKKQDNAFVSLADTFKNLKNADKMDFDVDFDSIRKNQPLPQFDDLDYLFD